MTEMPGPPPGQNQPSDALADFIDEALTLTAFVTADLRATEDPRAEQLSIIAATAELALRRLARAVREPSMPVTEDRCCHPRIELIAQRTYEPGVWEGLCASCGSSVVVVMSTRALAPTRPITVADLDALDEAEGGGT